MRGRVTLCVLLGAALPWATPAAASCEDPEARQLDFWVGEWNVDARMRAPGVEEWSPNQTWVATRVRADLGGCVIVEESLDRGETGTEVVGLSMSSYNSHLGQWQQVWMDNKGQTFEYVGGLEGDDFVLYLEHTTSAGDRLVTLQLATLIRMVFRDIEKKRLVWSYEYSTDEGRTWKATNEAVYTRRQ